MNDFTHTVRYILLWCTEMNVNTSSNSGSDKLTEKLGAAGGSEVETAAPTVTSAKASSSDKEEAGESPGSTEGIL